MNNEFLRKLCATQLLVKEWAVDRGSVGESEQVADVIRDGNEFDVDGVPNIFDWVSLLQVVFTITLRCGFVTQPLATLFMRKKRERDGAQWTAVPEASLAVQQQTAIQNQTTNRSSTSLKIPRV